MIKAFLKRFLLIIFLNTFFTSVYSQIPNLQWANRIGDSEGGLDRIVDLERDNEGNTYVVGYFRHALDVFPGPQQNVLYSTGNGDEIWFAKYDSNNSLLWANTIGNSSSENANALTIDADGNVYLTGYFVNTVDFDPSDSVFELTTFSASNSDAFFAKYSTNGELTWAKQLGGPNPDNGQDIQLDNNGNILVTGNFSDVGDLDPSDENEELFTATGFNDIFLAKYTNDGDYIWAFSLEGSAIPDNGQCIAIQADNSIVLGAIYQQDIDADPSSETLILPNANGYDVMIGTYSQSGDLIWAGSFGSNGVEQIHDIDLDNNGNIYAVGSFSTTVDFDLGVNTNEVTSVGNSDAYLASYTSAGDFRWVNTIGASSADEAKSVFIDENSNVLIAGLFNGEVDFDPGSGEDIHSSISTDIFFASYSISGDYNYSRTLGGTGYDIANVIYAQGTSLTIGGLFALTVDFDPSSADESRIGDNQTSFFAEYSSVNGEYLAVAAMEDRNGGDDQAYGVAVDNLGFSYVCGSFEGSPYFGSSSSVFSSNGESDGYLAKFSPSGTLVWSKQLGGTEPDAARAVTISNDGFVYVVGEFEGTMDIDGDAGSETLVSAGNTDAYIIKYDLDGNLIWSIALGGGADDANYAIDLDPNGNPFVCGQFRGLADFDPLGAGYELTPNNNDIFIAGYNADDASFIWARQINGPSNELGRTISIDSNGNIVAGGTFAGTIDVDPGLNTISVATAGGNDGILVKLDSDGNYIWHIQLGANSSDNITTTAFDDNNNLYVGGHFVGSTDADMNSSETLLTSNGANDIMIIKYLDQIDPIDLFPVLDWAYSFGNEADNYVYDLTVNNNSIYFTGTSSGIINFDHTGNADDITDIGISRDIYVAQLSITGEYENGFIIPGSSSSEYGYSIFAQNDDFYVAATFNGVIDGQPGAGVQTVSPFGDLDGLILKYGPSEPCESTSSTILETSCGSFRLNSTTYSTSGIYNQTMFNVAGCDSLITLNLTVLEHSSSEIIESACDEFILNKITYDATGIYTQTLVNAAGCDSTITLNLTINNLDPTVNIIGLVLSANQQGAEYQWINCDTNEDIEGATESIFNVVSAGSYAVNITNGACSGNSECFEFTTVHLNAELNLEVFNVFPNPSSGLFNIHLENAKNKCINYEVIDVRGKRVKDGTCVNSNFDINLNSFAQGVYFLRIWNDEMLKNIKIIKK